MESDIVSAGSEPSGSAMTAVAAALVFARSAVWAGADFALRIDFVDGDFIFGKCVSDGPGWIMIQPSKSKKTLDMAVDPRAIFIDARNVVRCEVIR